ncbi:hypothetical protein EX30DRAFT_70212 [Ascodesmis nigricans]|uniref:C2H2-type domain-containing protein n=1 Tax=Ascodesmis nigricans TaxID=341454 RepID=A0A4S2MTN2_9PEZI|nr:hypothetical protein EX30DRAFT_70212 [Ascodesmis nigricans]
MSGVYRKLEKRIKSHLPLNQKAEKIVGVSSVNYLEAGNTNSNGVRRPSSRKFSPTISKRKSSQFNPPPPYPKSEISHDAPQHKPQARSSPTSYPDKIDASLPDMTTMLNSKFSSTELSESLTATKLSRASRDSSEYASSSILGSIDQGYVSSSSLGSNRHSLSDPELRLSSKRDSGYESASARSSHYASHNGSPFRSLTRRDSGIDESLDSFSSTPTTSGLPSPVDSLGSSSSEYSLPQTPSHRRSRSWRNSLLEPCSPPPVTIPAAIHGVEIKRIGSPLSTISANSEENLKQPALESTDRRPARKSFRKSVSLDAAQNKSNPTAEKRVSLGFVQCLPSVSPGENNPVHEEGQLYAATSSSNNCASGSSDLTDLEELSRDLEKFAMDGTQAIPRGDKIIITGNQSEPAGDRSAETHQSADGTRQHHTGHGSAGSGGFYSNIGHSDQMFGSFADQFVPGDGGAPLGDGEGNDDEENDDGSSSGAPSPAKLKNKALKRCPWPNCGWSSRDRLKTHLRRVHTKPLECPENTCTQRFGDKWQIERHIKVCHPSLNDQTRGLPQRESEVNHFQHKLISSSCSFSNKEMIAICSANSRQDLVDISRRLRERPELNTNAVYEWRRILSRDQQRSNSLPTPESLASASPPSCHCSENQPQGPSLPAVHHGAYSIMKQLPGVSDIQAADTGRIVTAVHQIIGNSNMEMPDTDAQTLHALDSLRRAFDYLTLHLSVGARAHAAHTGLLQPLRPSPSIPSFDSPDLHATSDKNLPPVPGWEGLTGLEALPSGQPPSDSAYTSEGELPRRAVPETAVPMQTSPPVNPHRYPRRPSVRVMAHQYSIQQGLPPPVLVAPPPTSPPVQPERPTVLYPFGYSVPYGNYPSHRAGPDMKHDPSGQYDTYSYGMN